jgi:hypothetical protein
VGSRVELLRIGRLQEWRVALRLGDTEHVFAPDDAAAIAKELAEALERMHVPRGAVTRHARQRMHERYGFGLKRQEWRAMAESIADAIDRGEAFEHCPDVARSDAGDSRWRADVQVQREDGDFIVPIGFTHDGHTVTILTVLPGGGRCR